MMNAFSVICFVWAAIGIGSRIAMAVMGPRWKEWELSSAYSGKRPAWVVLAGIVGFLLIAFTWYQVAIGAHRWGWILAVLVSLSGVKAGMFLFRYNEFRAFVARALPDKRKMAWINVGVLLFSVALVTMGVGLYA